MPHKIVKTVLLDGPKKAHIHVYMESDGIERELSNFVLIDPKEDFKDSPLDVRMSITQIWYSFSWFDALLKFDNIDPQPAWQLTRDAHNYHDFRYFGGLTDRAEKSPETSLDGTGKILLSTNNFQPLGSIGTMVLEIQKNK